VAYVWPGGTQAPCSQVQPTTPGNFLPEGCPPVIPGGGHVAGAGDDDLVDKYSVQGGKIHLGGFSLGFGVKFTF